MAVENGCHGDANKSEATSPPPEVEEGVSKYTCIVGIAAAVASSDAVISIKPDSYLLPTTTHERDP
jgi:hypothetical protein